MKSSRRGITQFGNGTFHIQVGGSFASISLTIVRGIPLPGEALLGYFGSTLYDTTRPREAPGISATNPNVTVESSLDPRWILAKRPIVSRPRCSAMIDQAKNTSHRRINRSADPRRGRVLLHAFSRPRAVVE